MTSPMNTLGGHTEGRLGPTTPDGGLITTWPPLGLPQRLKTRVFIAPIGFLIMRR
jgi:hypothetical protein